ncbi:hypothetical protein ACFXOS_19760 [Streptomyces sp. NPDC059175]|uniref:hypothetical protein n=1 Tax=Streptomyces sp. NPDC059175 TaxID=3346757 RepID=UPI0036C822B8
MKADEPSAHTERNRQINKKILTFGCLPITIVLALVIIAAAVGGNSTEDDAKSPEATVKAPAYTVANKREKTKLGSVDLVIPNATVDQAKAAIEDYAQTIGDRFLNYGITVVRSDADKVFVCRAEWVKDEQAAKIYTGGRITSDTWPALKTECPDPKG